MDRIISVEEKIKRAEEIYARRNNENRGRTTTKLGLNANGKKDIKIFKKLILQIIICLFIYSIFYIIKNNNYIFSNDFVNKAKEVLSYDINFQELYNNVSKNLIEIFTKNNESQELNNNSEGDNKEQKIEEKNEEVNNSIENNEVQDNSKNEESNNIGGASNVDDENNHVQVSQEEQQIQKIKNTATFIKPVQGYISSKYGLRNPTTTTVPKNHTGTDIAANLGTKIISSTDGEVVIASSDGDYGNHLKIQIGEVSVVYAHCNKLYVSKGDQIKQGQEIAEVGTTGNSTGPHLHFEIRLNEKTVDPEKILEL